MTLVDKWLGCLFRMCVEIDLFYNPRVGNFDLVVSRLQYMDDILILLKALIDTLWAIKNILMVFKYASGLRLHFAKNGLIGGQCLSLF